MTDNVIYGHFAARPPTDKPHVVDRVIATQSRMADIQEVFKLPEAAQFPPNHWSHRYVAIGDLAAACSTITAMLPLLNDTALNEVERHLVHAVHDLVRAINEERAKRREQCQQENILTW